MNKTKGYKDSEEKNHWFEEKKINPRTQKHQGVDGEELRSARLCLLDLTGKHLHWPGLLRLLPGPRGSSASLLQGVLFILASRLWSRGGGFRKWTLSAPSQLHLSAGEEVMGCLPERWCTGHRTGLLFEQLREWFKHNFKKEILGKT